MPDAGPRLRQLRDCANGSAVHYLDRAKTLGFRQMWLSLDDPVGTGAEIDRPVVCIAHGIDMDLLRQWATGRYRQDPLHRMKVHGELSSGGNQPLLWENHQGRIVLSNGAPKLTAGEKGTMQWIYDHGFRTGVNIRPCEVNGREVCISFGSNQSRDDIACLDDVMAILFYLSHMIARDLKQELMGEAAPDAVILTKREGECLQWVAAGKNAQETAIILGLSVETIRDHLKRVRSKLNSRTRAQAVMRAFELGLIARRH